MAKGVITAITVTFLVTFSAADGVCRGKLSYVVTSIRNNTGHRDVASHLSVSGGEIEPKDVRLEVQQSSCAVGGNPQLRISTFVSMPDPRSPPTGYELVPELGWYRLYTTPRTWDDARLACEADGAQLAVLNSAREATVLKGIFARAPDAIPKATFSHVAHIGFTDLVEGHYLTIFGETLEQAGYTQWGSSQPNDAGGSTDSGADCGGIERTGKLNDLPCRSLNAYICEFPL